MGWNGIEWYRMEWKGMEREWMEWEAGAYTGFFLPPLDDFCPPPLALKMLLFYIKSTTCPRPMWPIVVPIQGLYIIMYLSSVLLFEVLSSLLRLLPFVVPCSPDSRTKCYYASLCIVLYYSLKSWVGSWDYSP